MVFLDLGASYQALRFPTPAAAPWSAAHRSGDAAALLAVADDLYHAGLEQMRPGQTVDDVAQALMRVVRGTRWEAGFFPGRLWSWHRHGSV